MNESHAFLAMFTIQILAGSVVGPALFIRRVRANVASFALGRFAELFPGVDKEKSAKRFAGRHRTLNTGIAVLGLVLLGWLFIFMQRPDWSLIQVMIVTVAYFLVQSVPILLVGWKGSKHSRMLKDSLPDRKRRAVLQRRGLFDFISPFVMFLAVLGYCLFAVLVLYMIRNTPFPKFAGLFEIGIVTLVYALNAAIVFRYIYGGKRSPLQTHADRVYAIGSVVKNCVRTCIAVTLFQSAYLTLLLLHLNRWGPFALSAFFVITILLSSAGAAPRPHRSGEDGVGSGGPLPPATPDLSA